MGHWLRARLCCWGLLFTILLGRPDSVLCAAQQPALSCDLAAGENAGPANDPAPGSVRPGAVQGAPSSAIPPAGLGWISRSGAIGMVRMPSALVTPEGDLELAYLGSHSGEDVHRLGNSTTYAMSIGLLPRLEVGATLGNLRQIADLSPNVKLQLLSERGSLPSLAAGVVELSKTGANPTYYGVLTRSLLHKTFWVTAGLQHRSDVGTKPYGGLEIRIIRGLSVVAEHDSRDLNYGVRVPFRTFQVAAFHVEGAWNVQAGVRVPLSTRRAPPAMLPIPRPGENMDAASAVQAVEQRLIALGLENVAVRVVGSTTSILEVSYENRSFPHSEMDALANVLASAAAYAPRGITAISAVVLRDALPVLRFSCPLEEYVHFMAGEFPEVEFAPLVRVEPGRNGSIGAEGSPTVLAETGTHARSYGRADVYLRPGITTQIGSETTEFLGGLDFRPELDLPVARGVGIDARAFIPVAGPLQSADPGYDRLVLHLSAQSSTPVLTRVFIGRFPQSRDGAVGEVVWAPGDGRWLGRASLGVLNRRDGGTQQNPTAVGEGRYYLPWLDLSLSLAGGRYLEGDTGAVAGLLRRFGDTEVGIQVRSTNLGNAGVLSLGIPLGPNHLETRPSLLRIRPPDFLDYLTRTEIARPNSIVTAAAIGNEAVVGTEVEESLLDRDRLFRAYVLRSLADLRRARPVDQPRH